MAQTPQQRKANAKFAKSEENKMGSLRAPKLDKDARKKMEIDEKFRASPTSKVVVYLLVFVLLGGIILELLRLFF